jgi:hypothetical protein
MLALVKCIHIGTASNDYLLKVNNIYLVEIPQNRIGGINDSMHCMLLDDGSFDERASPTFVNIE